MIQVGLKPLTRLGLNTFALIIVKDRRHNQFEDSLLGIVESSLCDGPIYFKCFPNFMVSLTYPNILQSLVLNIKTEGFYMMKGTPNIVSVYRLCYKVMNTVVPNIRNNPNFVHDRKGETTLFITDLEKKIGKERQRVKILRVNKTPEQINQPEYKVEIPESSHRQRENNSPTLSDMGYGINTITEELVFPKMIQKMFNKPGNKHKKQWFLSYHSFKKQKWYLKNYIYYCEKIGEIIDFFQWIEEVYYELKKDFPNFNNSSCLAVIESTYQTYITIKGKPLQTIHPLRTSLIMKIEDRVIDAIPFKFGIANDDINHVLQQNNYTNMCMQSTSKQTSRLKKLPTPVNLQFEEKAKFAQFNEESIVEWNIDGMSKYQIRTIIKYMLMYPSAAKLKGNNDEAIAKAIVTGFTGHLQEWWDFYLQENAKDKIFKLVGANELHSDRTTEELINLRCPTFSYFYWYKATFLSKVMTRKDCNKDLWKEKFLSGLPKSFAERMRNKLKAKYNNTIPYSKLAYGDLAAQVIAEGINFCNEMKLKKQFELEKIGSREILGDFCEQIGYQPIEYPKKEKLWKKEKKCQKERYKGEKFRRKEKSSPEEKLKVSKKTKQKKKKIIIYWKCSQVGHYANRCKFKKKIESLDLDEGLKKSLCKILLNEEGEDLYVNIASKESESEIEKESNDFSNRESKEHSEEECKEFCECAKCYVKNYSLRINVLTKEEKNFAATSKEKKVQFEDEESEEEEEEKPSTFEEINFLSSEKIHQELKRVNTLYAITKKWFIEVTLIINKEFSLKVEAMADSGADLNCISKGLIPSQYYSKTTQVIIAANRQPLPIEYKLSDASICNNGVCLPMPFIMVKNLSTSVILGNPFLHMLFPIKRIDEKWIISNFEGNEFPFITLPKNKFQLQIRKWEANNV
ncbi:hypothetical protein CDL12_02435 [Handroanthus impetiginosus]|uniref:Uncharacterized protein n=1 Tax=Handroanthus impetiginosus TaxID=429701 RepID=A0A2G9I501_9LAMI|nr:hypothetical protein CDL12_02435 [Handroanthus impetiginosus]